MFEPLTDGRDHPNGWPVVMGVSSAYEARQHGAAWGVTHLLAITHDVGRLRTMTGIPDERRLVLEFADVDEEAEMGGPTPAHVETVRRFVDGLPADARLLVHCLQGMGQATAVGLGILARYLPPEAAGAALHAMRPTAVPNMLIVEQWDAALELRGALVKVATRFPCRVWRAAKRSA